MLKTVTLKLKKLKLLYFEQNFFNKLVFVVTFDELNASLLKKMPDHTLRFVYASFMSIVSLKFILIFYVRLFIYLISSCVIVG